jgi:hypothetical protein
MSNTSKNIAIIQPGKIGDIFICLPIARYYSLKGYKIVWPIHGDYFDMFHNAIDYVDFYPVCGKWKNIVSQSIEIAKQKDCDIINLAFGFPTMEEFWKKWRTTGKHFDEYKYEIANVPFEEKWNLFIKRDMEKEESFFKSLNLEKPYLLFQKQSSDTSIDIVWTAEEEKLNKVEIRQISNNVFDWIKTIEMADKLVMIDSCFVNLVDQLKIGVKKRRLRKPLYNLDIDYPILKGEWEQK